MTMDCLFGTASGWNEPAPDVASPAVLQSRPARAKIHQPNSNVLINIEDEKLGDLKIKLHVLNPLEI